MARRLSERLTAFCLFYDPLMCRYNIPTAISSLRQSRPLLLCSLSIEEVAGMAGKSILSLVLLSTYATAYPFAMDGGLQARQTGPPQGAGALPAAPPPFDANLQRVSNSGANRFIAPGRNDARGPCPVSHAAVSSSVYERPTDLELGSQCTGKPCILATQWRCYYPTIPVRYQ